MRIFPNRAENITKSDTDTFDQVSIVRVGTAGDVKIKTSSGDDVTIPDVLAGEVLNVEIVRVYSTGTTASGFTRFWSE